MRRPTSALAKAVLGTALAASTVSAQQSPPMPSPDAGPAQAPTPGSGSASDAPLVNPGRSARHLVRNGWDYITYQQYDKALTFFREAQSRQAELNDSERTKLRQGIDRAQRGIREGASGINTGPAYALNGSNRRPGALAVASPAASSKPATPAAEREPIQLVGGAAAAAAVAAGTGVALVSTDQAQASPAVSGGPTPVQAPNLTPAPIPAPPGAEPTPLPTLPGDPEPVAAPTPAPEPIALPPATIAPPADAPAPAPVALPEPTPEPVAAPTALATAVPDLPPAPADIELPTLPGETPAAAPAAAAATAPTQAAPAQPAPVQTASFDNEALPPLPSSLISPPPAVEPPPAPAAETLPAPAPAAVPSPEPAPAPAAIPVAPARSANPAVETLPSMDMDPVVLPSAPAAEPAPALAAEPTPAPAPAPSQAPIPVPAPEPAEQPRSEAPDQAPMPAPVPLAVPATPPAAEDAPPVVPDTLPPVNTLPPVDTLPPVPDAPPPPPADEPSTPKPSSRGRFGTDTLIPERSDSHKSTLTPDQQLEVDRIARRQDEEMRQNPPVPLASPDAATPDSPASPTGPASTRLEISRAPSPTEARPIRAIPVPEEFVPLPKREWSPNRKYWSAAATAHLPLYFQDAALERYGYSVEQHFGWFGRFMSIPVDDPRQSKQRNQIVQPFFSIGLFAAQCALLPYNMIMDPPWEAEYDLGYYRPGDRVPKDVYYLPLTGIGPPLLGKNYAIPPGSSNGAPLPPSRW